MSKHQELLEEIRQIAQAAIDYIPSSDPGDREYEEEMSTERGLALEAIVRKVSA